MLEHGVGTSLGFGAWDPAELGREGDELQRREILHHGVVLRHVADEASHLEWVLDALGTVPGEPPRPRTSLLGDVSYAFWESTDHFLVRLGELGREPVHVRMARTDGEWRVVAVFE